MLAEKTPELNYIDSDTKHVIMFEPNQKNQTPREWLEINRDSLEMLLNSYGAVLLRGFEIHGLSDFNRFINSYSPVLLDYVNRSTPRVKLGGKIYSSTQYPQDRVIPQHNENSYTLKWPSRLIFFSVIAAETGGQTPLADSRKVLARLPQDFVQRCEKHGIAYIRHYHPNIDLSWKEAFQTNQKDEVEAYCKNNNIEYEWLDNGSILRTKQICQATTMHLVSGEKVWFNQAHLFNAKANGQKQYQMLIDEFGKDRLPRNTFLGDGSEISEEILQVINEAYESEMISFSWHHGDILIIDNVLMSHGRRTYTGPRKVAVAMA